ncbi:MAG: hypothetical protein HON94_05200, partial [Methylococcales bacterium]|nr:hypothetical protein [Methylococcales bacterium]
MISLRTKKVLSHRGISFVRTNARFNPALIFTLFIFFVTPIGHASLDADELINEDSFEDAFDESFEIETEQTEKTTFQNNSRLLRFTFAHEIGYHPDNTNKLPVNRSSLRLEWEHLITQQIFFRFDAKMAYDFAYDHHQYPVATTQNYRFQKKIREMYFQSTHQKISVKIGKQILVWGEADGAIVTDIISPRNLTEFIFQPIEDTRIGQIMLTIDYFSHNHHWTLLLNPDRKTNQFALPGHEYALFNPLQNNPLINLTKEQTPKTSLSDMEVGLRWKKTFSGHDVSFMLAEVTNNNPVLASQTIQNQQITL